MTEARRWGEPAGAWPVLAACVLTIVLVAGARSSFAAFLLPIEAELGLDRATLSTAGTLTQLGYGLSLPIVGRLATRFGAKRVMMISVAVMTIGGFGVSAATQAWQILLFAGVLPGMGFGGATVVPATVLLSRWFGRRLGLATGVMTSALPAGQSLFVPLATALIPVWGWRSTYVLLGLVLALVALPALGWLAAEPPHAATAASRSTSARPARAGLDVWLLAAGYFACGFTDQFVTLHLVALGVEAGVEPIVAAGFFSLLMALGIAGSVLSGRLSDTWSPRTLLSSLYLARAASLPLLLVVGPGPRLILLALFALVFGPTYIGNQAAGTRLIRDRYGVQAVGPLIGNTGLCHQIGGAAGIALGGLSVAYAGSYGPAVVAAALVALVGGLLQQLIPARAASSPAPA